jgi:hypothetical protein
MRSRIILRLMAELLDEAAALRFENSVQARIAVFSNIKQSESKRYWKIPEWFEVNLYLQPRITPEAAYEGILTSLGEGWERHTISNDEQWAVWNANDDSRFFSSCVRWANLELFPEAAVRSP